MKCKFIKCSMTLKFVFALKITHYLLWLRTLNESSQEINFWCNFYVVHNFTAMFGGKHFDRKGVWVYKKYEQSATAWCNKLIIALSDRRSLSLQICSWQNLFGANLIYLRMDYNDQMFMAQKLLFSVLLSPTGACVFYAREIMNFFW